MAGRDAEHYDNMIRAKARRDDQRDNYLESSKERLLKIAEKKIMTAGVGALKSIEVEFGFLWGLDENGNESYDGLSDEQLHMKGEYQKVRNAVFDTINTQIRGLREEFKQYVIDWKRYQVNLPVKPEGPTGGKK